MKRILFCNEFADLNTGYATYGKQLISRLVSTEKYEIAELSTYGTNSDIAKSKLPWKLYANMPELNGPEWKPYKEREVNQFGAWRFERVLLDFKPDIVVDIRDPWMFQHEYLSPYRKFFRWVVMPPVDSFPINEAWLEMYRDSDALLMYTHWARNELLKYTNNNISVYGVTPYGLDYDLYKPNEHKKEAKMQLDISPNSLIVGTVMRNQVRKLYPDLFESFRDFLRNAPKEVAERSYLYIHTAYPDKKGWDIPTLIKEFELSGHVLCSYMCKFCKKPFSAIFKDARTRCQHCNQLGAVMPNVKFGYSLEEMIKVYQLFDIYIQYAICEGFGMPVLEAAGCGVPVAAVDFSAMSDLCNFLNGYKIRVQRLHRVLESNVVRAYPDNKHLTEILLKFSKLSDIEKEQKGLETRNLAQKTYEWNAIGKCWEMVLDGQKPPERKWDEEPEFFEIPKSIPNNLTNKEFVSWLFKDVLHDPEVEYSSLAADIMRDLNYGVALVNNKVTEVSRKNIFENMCSMARNKIHAEQVRCGMLPLANPDYIQVANSRKFDE